MAKGKKQALVQAAPEDVDQEENLASDDEENPSSGSMPDLSDSEDGSGSGDDSFPEVSDEEPLEESDGGSSEYEDDEENVQEINVDFEFFDPEEKDFHGLKSLLTNYLDGEDFHSTGLIDAIVAESDLGSVVKTGEDDDPIAVMTVLNCKTYNDTQFMKQIQDWLTSKCAAKGGACKAQLSQALSSPNTGLIVNERLINSHPKLGPPLVQFLMEAIKDKQEEDGADAVSYKFERFLLAARVFVDSQGGQGGDGEGRPAKKSKTEDGEAPSARQQQLVFIRPEDEYFHKHSSWSFTCPIEGKPVTKDGLIAYRLVMQIDANKVPAARAELDSVVGNMAAGYVPDDDEDDDDEDSDNQEQEEEEAAAAVGQPSSSGGGQQSGKKRKQDKAQKKGKEGPSSGKASGSGMNADDVQRMAAEMFAAAAAAGAGRGAGQGQGKKNKKKGGAGVKAVQL